MQKLIIAIDGHSSTGKSTIAKQLAKDLNYKYIDTGAMYRAATLFAIQHNLFSNENQLDEQQLLAKLDDISLQLIYNEFISQYQLLMNDEIIEDKIRGMEVSSRVSYVAKIPEVRAKMVAIQQKWGEERGIVMDGRDIGTVVFPNADLKFFITASAQVRAERRYKELIAKGEKVNFEEILQNVTERDFMDSNRAVAPLKPASDAIIIDNSDLTPSEQYELIMNYVKKKLSQNKS